MKRVRVFILFLLSLFACLASAADATKFTRTEDVIYGRKFGTALTLDVFQAQVFAEAARAAGATCEVVVRMGKDHTWPEMVTDRMQFADWFDRHLRGNAK